VSNGRGLILVSAPPALSTVSKIAALLKEMAAVIATAEYADTSLEDRVLTAAVTAEELAGEIEAIDTDEKWHVDEDAVMRWRRDAQPGFLAAGRV
jgi:hypothetical protein